jgi:CubicO group peptidase (beta-lactamase class C family)
MRPTILLILVLASLTFSCKTENTDKLLADIQAIENGLLPPVRVMGDSTVSYNLQERMAHYNVPGVSLAIVENGEIKWAKGYGIANSENGSEVGTTTLFQAASISKPIAALAVLKMVEAGLVDLDEDVNLYLKDWKIPESNFTQEKKVTLRGLLTHTAGITVHGFPGYATSDKFPSITEVLNGNGNTAKVYVDTIPGSIWRYSGGGYTIIEKVIENQSGLLLGKYMSKHIFPEIGMDISTFQQPLGLTYHDNASLAYDTEGKIIEGNWHNYPEKAAAGLWTTPTDLAKYCIEIHQILSGKVNGVLSKETIEAMLTKHRNEWGLGPALSGAGDSLIFLHGGKNAGFTNNLISFAHRGNAMIIMTNADNGRQLISEI